MPIYKIYTVKQVSSYLHVTDATVRRWIKERRLDANRVGRKYQITELQLENFIEDNKNYNHQQNIVTDNTLPSTQSVVTSVAKVSKSINTKSDNTIYSDDGENGGDEEQVAPVKNPLMTVNPYSQVWGTHKIGVP